jgi:hypothetical protein
MAIKLQVLADFVAELTEAHTIPTPVDLIYWMMYFNGVYIYIMLKDVGMTSRSSPPKGDCLKYVIQLHFKSTNNVAE